MIGAVIRLELRRSRLLVLWLVVITVGYGGAIAAFYPVIKQNTKVLEDYMNAFPKPLIAAFGMEGSLADPGIFWNTYIGSMLWPVLAAIAAIIVGTRITAADTERGWIELPLAGRLPRTAYLLASIAVQLVVMGILAFATVGGVVAVGALVGAGFDVGRFAIAGVAAWIFGCAVIAVTSLLAVITLNRGMSGGIVAGALLGMYLLRAIALIQPSLDWLGAFSAFRYLNARWIVDTGTFPIGDAVLFVAVSVAAWAGSMWAFRRRDLIA